MSTPTRINSIDLLRGIVMIIMALDHTRDYFHSQAFTDDPLNLDTTTPALFVTRWITHFCAPVFVFLSGTSAYLQGLRKTKKQLSIFLLTRGLWLILVEVLIMTFAISFDVGYHMLILQVIWTIGISMVLLSAIIWLPFPLILMSGVIIVFGHNLLDFQESAREGSAFPFWYSLLHRPGIYTLAEGHSLDIFYPFLPWTGVMILGYCFGRFYLQNEINRNKRTILLGAGIITLFIILRFMNMYGDPLDWSEQNRSLYTFFSFIKTQKYPPSLLYICMTLGPSLVMLGLLGNVKNKFTNAVSVYGKVPLFYYILHFFIIHFLSSILYLMRGHSFEEGVKGIRNFPFRFLAPAEGYGLEVVYLIWILIVITLYPLCKWYAGYKQHHRKWWLSYL